MTALYSKLINLLDLFSPELSARLVYRLLSNPQIQKERQRETRLLDQAETWSETVVDAHIRAHAWGHPEHPILFLIHGWEGHTGNFAGLIPLLVDKGYRVMGFDAPSHGHSSRRSTDMFEYGRLLAILMKKFHPIALVSHSFGTTSAALALRSLQQPVLDSWIMIASPFTFRSRIETVRKLYEIPENTMSALPPLIETRSGETIDDLNFNVYSPFLDGIRDIHVVHSQSDGVVPFSYAEDIHQALPQSSLHPVDDLGHFGILWAEALIGLVDKTLPGTALKT